MSNTLSDLLELSNLQWRVECLGRRNHPYTIGDALDAKTYSRALVNMADMEDGLQSPEHQAQILDLISECNRIIDEYLEFRNG